MTEQYQQRFGMPEGVYVSEVTKNSPAEKAGMHDYDIIVSFDGKDVATMDDLTDAIGEKVAGDTVKIKVKRSINNAYTDVELTVKLGSVSDKPKQEEKQQSGGYSGGDMEDFYRYFFGNGGYNPFG